MHGTRIVELEPCLARTPRGLNVRHTLNKAANMLPPTYTALHKVLKRWAVKGLQASGRCIHQPFCHVLSTSNKLCWSVLFHVQASDIERPAQLPTDQLPVMPTAQPAAGSPAPSSTLGNGRGPAGQQAAAGIGYAGSGSNGGRPDVAARAPPSSSTSTYRRRWQDNIGSKR